MADEISVSIHAGSGKNAIDSMDKIKRCDLHNNRKYKNNKNEQIDLSLSKYNITLKGTKNITEDIRKFYKEEFGEAVYKYNQKQKDERRKIVDYLEKINKERNNIAVEFIFQIGDKQDWEEVSIEDKAKTKDIFEKAIGILEKRGIKTVNASLHLDETSPHLHLIAVPVVENQKRGLEKQVSQRQVLTLKTLYEVRKEVEEIFIQEYNKIYGTSKELKKGCEIEEHLSVEDYKDTKKILEVAKKVGDRKEFKRELDINLSELDEDLKKLKEEIETKKEEQSKLTRLEKELDIVIKEQKRVKEEKEKEIADLQENVKSKEELEKDLKERKKDLLEIKNEVEFKNEELESAKNSLIAIQNNIEKQYLLENQLKDKINEYNKINDELKTKTIEVKEIEEKVKANDEIMSIYKTKINSFDDDLEKIKKEAEEKEKKKEQEETLLQTRKKELEEIQNNRTNIENLIRQAEEKKKANTEKRKELQELEEQENKLETAIKDKKNSIKENTDILKELETEEKILEEKKKIVDEKKATRIVGDKIKELQKVLKRIDKIKAGDIFYCFSNLETFSNFEKENYNIFKDEIRRYFNSAKNEIEFAIKNDDKILETINSFCPDDVFEKMKALNEIAVEDYGFEDEEIEIDKGKGYGD
ncbi:plasmid recombination protein [Fusobacterium periodonticum]|nr:plasmid recombination protein [Fusobacterium periodonticum]